MLPIVERRINGPTDSKTVTQPRQYEKYARVHRTYKAMIKESRQDYAAAQEKKLIDEAEYSPFQALKIKMTEIPKCNPH
jgi:hypothetical protein